MHPRFRKQLLAFQHRHKNQHEIVFGLQSPSGKYSYSTSENSEVFAGLLLTDTYCNELLWTHTKSYLDLDSKTTLSDLGLSEAQFVDKFNAFLQTSYMKYLGITVLKKHIFWTSSCRKEKLSFHIVINHPDNYWHVSDRGSSMKSFFKQLVSDSLTEEGLHVFQQTDTEYKKVSLIDLAVYSKNRLFRCIGQSKRQVDVPLRPLKGGLTAVNIINHLITLSDVEGMNRICFKENKRKTLVQRKENGVSSKLLDKLAEACDCTVAGVRGSLITLQNKQKVRKCVLAQGVCHTRNNGYFVKRNNEILFGCHGCPDLPLKVVHTFEQKKEFEFYESYKKILDIYRNQPENFDPALITTYIRQTVTFIDKANDPHFIVRSRVPVLAGKMYGTQILSAKNLFFKHSDIHLSHTNSLDGTKEVLKFSKVLSDNTKKRLVKTYNDTCWIPYAKGSKYQPELSDDTLNLFSGYNLENYRPTKNIDFEKTHIFQLLHRNLTNRDPACFSYLCSFIAHKLQKSWVKIPTCQIWANSLPGTGKSSMSRFLKTLFSCGKEQVLCSYSNMESFQSAFNFEKRHALFIALEECPQNKRNKDFDSFLKDFISAPDMLLEIKGQDRKTVPSYSSVLVYSNRMKVISVDQRDRRMVFYICNNEEANKKEFFDALYSELSDLDVMKSAFDFFLEYDISKWDYRKFPITSLRRKVQQCSIQLDIRWLRYFFGLYEFRTPDNCYNFDKTDLFVSWKVYIDSHGINSKRDFDYVTSSFELAMNVECNERDVYQIPYPYATSKLTEFFGVSAGEIKSPE